MSTLEHARFSKNHGIHTKGGPWAGTPGQQLVVSKLTRQKLAVSCKPCGHGSGNTVPRPRVKILTSVIILWAETLLCPGSVYYDWRELDLHAFWHDSALHLLGKKLWLWPTPYQIFWKQRGNFNLALTAAGDFILPVAVTGLLSGVKLIRSKWQNCKCQKRPCIVCSVLGQSCTYTQAKSVVTFAQNAHKSYGWE